MKKHVMLIAAFLAVLVTSVPTLAWAADTGGPDSFIALQRMRSMQAMHMIDADGKGYVTKEELTKFVEDLFEKMDKKHDGKITAEEWLGRAAAKSDE